MVTRFIIEDAYTLLFERIFREIGKRKRSSFILIDEGGKDRNFIKEMVENKFSPYIWEHFRSAEPYLFGIGNTPSFVHAGVQLADIVSYFWRRIYEQFPLGRFEFVEKKLEKLAIKAPDGKTYGYGIKDWW